ncbi:hypothetical protein A2954_01515 [Candidatus Roizmanbacteria bacterium RIFCSPLOWO2_01_FULL_37_12]|uniref:DNA-directed DNA polymerase n=1 Tax=Candidatus Roizmanbacteria bacterium RIFCSPLOWO2_01_FULL_37_12 TaxID=1802056 RepID=A0A1F7I8Y8_9BACT|nr:MAG: hypothetical protein A2954_01515 [Candidatus Roizmanbacteria bacterium RIFCSPLOWO2_01_FULL_37_12]
MKSDQNKFSNKEIAKILRNIAAVHLLKNENRFKRVAYENAAETVEQSSRELRDIWQDGKLFDIPGIGKTIGSNLEEYFKTGKSKHFNSILKKVPSTVFILMNLPTIGPKKAYKLVKELKLLIPKTVIEDLQNACKQNKVAELESFGKKSQEDILEAIKLFRKRSSKSERMPLPYAYELAKELSDYLKKIPGITRVDTLGSLRRMVATIGDIDISVQVESRKDHKVERLQKEIINYFVKFPKTISIDSSGENKASIIVSPNIRVDLRVQEERSYGAMLQYFTGSKSHNIKLREYALKKGLSLNEYGIKKVKSQKSKVKSINQNSKILEFSTEEKFYNFLGLQYIPPEIREGTNEIELSEKNKVSKLVELKDIKGDLHIHSSYDLKPSHDLGENSYSEILEKADQLGYEYIGFTDHNPKTSGLPEQEITEIMNLRYRVIKKLSNKVNEAKFFIGLEADIQPDGRLALPEKAIDLVDYLIVSVHSAFNLDVKSMTQRVMKALSYPKVKILGHPTGRLLGKREGFELDWKAIFDFCRNKKIALEINSWPERLDLPDSLVREALNQKVKFVINTDAHANLHLDGMIYGVSVARRGWCKKDDIINTLDYSAFKRWLNNKS